MWGEGCYRANGGPKRRSGQCGASSRKTGRPRNFPEKVRVPSLSAQERADPDRVERSMNKKLVAALVGGFAFSSVAAMAAPVKPAAEKKAEKKKDKKGGEKSCGGEKK